jgi:hypothetical protein
MIFYLVFNNKKKEKFSTNDLYSLTDKPVKFDNEKLIEDERLVDDSKKIKIIKIDGVTYFGEVNNENKPHGRGIKYNPRLNNPYFYDAEFKNGKPTKYYASMQGIFGEVSRTENSYTIPGLFQSFISGHIHDNNKNKKNPVNSIVYDNGTIYEGQTKIFNTLNYPHGEGILKTRFDGYFKGKWKKGKLYFKDMDSESIENSVIKELNKGLKINPDDFIDSKILSINGKKYYFQPSLGYIDREEAFKSSGFNIPKHL